MDQTQAVQRQMPTPTTPSMTSPDQMPQKKSGWFKWVIIILLILVIGGLAWYILTP